MRTLLSVIVVFALLAPAMCEMSIHWDFTSMTAFADIISEADVVGFTPDPNLIILSENCITVEEFNEDPNYEYDGYRGFACPGYTGYSDFQYEVDACQIELDGTKFPVCDGCSHVITITATKFPADVDEICDGTEDIFNIEQYFGRMNIQEYEFVTTVNNGVSKSVSLDHPFDYLTPKTYQITKTLTTDTITLTVEDLTNSVSITSMTVTDSEWESLEMIAEPSIILPICANVQDIKLSFVSPDDEEVVGTPPGIDQTTELSVGLFETRLAYLESLDSVSSDCEYSNTEYTITSVINLPALPTGGVSNLAYEIYYDKYPTSNPAEKEETLLEDHDTASFSETESTITITYTFEEMKDTFFFFESESDETLDYNTNFYIKFFATEDDSKATMRQIVLETAIEVDKTTEAVKELTTSQLQELDACGCVIKNSIGSTVKLYGNIADCKAATDTSADDGNELSEAVQVGTELCFQHVINDDESEYKTYYKLSFSNMYITYMETDFDYDASRLTDQCDDNTNCVTDVRYSFTPSMMGSLSLNVISTLERITRRDLEESKTGVLKEVNFEIVEATSDSVEAQTDSSSNWWIYLVIGIIGIAIASIVGTLVVKKLRRKDVSKKYATEKPIQLQI